MDNSTESGMRDADWSLYLYDPVKALPPVFAAVILVTLLWQSYQSFYKYGGEYKKLGFIMAWGNIIWIGGFVMREVSIYNDQNVGFFIAQYVMILVGPPVYAAAEYFVLGRLLWYLPYFAPLHPGRVVSTFIGLGILVETFTGAGAGNSAGPGRTQGQRDVGKALIKASLFLQAVVELFFLAIVCVVLRRAARAGMLPRNVRRVGGVLVVTSFLVLLRCVFRVADVFLASPCGGLKDFECGPADRHEWTLWVFEVGVMVVYCYLLNLFNPGRYLPPKSCQYLDPRDGRTERIGPGWRDTRAWWKTVVDPFGLWPLLMRTDPVVKFWEEDNPLATGKSFASGDNNLSGSGGEAAKSDVESNVGGVVYTKG